jgi:hypothetical protein
VYPVYLYVNRPVSSYLKFLRFCRRICIMDQNTLGIIMKQKMDGCLYLSVRKDGVLLIATREVFDNFKTLQHGFSFVC